MPAMSDSSANASIDHVLIEDRLFPPPADFTRRAVIKTQEEYERLYAAAKDNPEEFWRTEAEQHLHWFEPFDEVCRWEAPHAQWFVGGKTNASYNCLDAHIEAGNGDRVAIIWEGEPGDTRTLTYRELRGEVCKTASALLHLGVG